MRHRAATVTETKENVQRVWPVEAKVARRLSARQCVACLRFGDSADDLEFASAALINSAARIFPRSFTMSGVSAFAGLSTQR
jgi:hypothetical protein